MLVDCRDTNKIKTDEELDNMFCLVTSGKELLIHFYHLPSYGDIVRYSNRAGKHKLEAEYNADNDVLTIRCPHSVALKRYYDGQAYIPEGKNKMGCSESWYDPYYAITQTFTSAEVDKMDDCEIDDLVRLAESIQGALY